MKLYGIQYINRDGVLSYYAFTCPFLSVRTPIDSAFYDDLKSRCILAGKNNSSLQGEYYLQDSQ